MTDPLYQNSIYIMASTFILAILGFVFWIFIAKLYDVETVGIATTLISIMTLISSFSLLGLNVGLIRYLPKSSVRNETITSSFILATLSTILITSAFFFGLNIFSPKLLFLQKNYFYFVSFSIFMIGATFNILIESIFMAYRAASNILLKNTVLSILKLCFPFFFISFGSYGIFTATALATLLSVIISCGILVFRYNYKPALVFNTTAVKVMAFFSGGNYIAGFLSQAPTLILPLLIINYLHSATAAYYYVDAMILNLLVIIPLATTQSLLTEGSYNSALLREHTIKTVKIIFLLLIPAILIIFFFGNILLNFFGKTYEAEAFAFLKIISVSAIFMAISLIGNAILKIRHQIKTLIVMSLLSFIFGLGFPYLFIPHGLAGVGWGWLLGQCILAIAYLFMLRKEVASVRN
ncbi:MAG: oligosaccharide flippase family protein [Candidatus Woykebacteria bacterium]